MADVFDVLKERGYVQQCSDEPGLRKLLESGKVSYYCGFDPTGSSLHVGHLVPLFAMSHLQKAGHKPIALVGGGTARIGDPSGRTDMRKMLTVDQIKANAECFKKQISRFLDFSEGKAMMVDNADWLASLNYIEFLRDIGKHFSVNRMLTFETYKIRLETGLTFIEFNYQLLQSYDFLVLYKKHGCTLQIGGDDQWGNIVSGIDLIRRVESGEAYALTAPLVARADGKKMGKTEKGALFLDPALTSPYDFYQYWVNIPDQDVEKFLLLYTFIPVAEVKKLASAKDKDINESKKVLAFELTKTVHGEAEAKKAKESAEALFGNKGGSADLSDSVTRKLSKAEFEGNANIVSLFVACGLCSSKSEARRLVEQGGASVDDEPCKDMNTVFEYAKYKGKSMLLRAGKKRYCRISIE